MKADAAVAAALLEQGRILHHATLALLLPIFFTGPKPLAVAAVLVAAAETYHAVRVGLDARLFARIADGADPRAIDAGLVGARLVRSTPPDRPLGDRIAGAIGLLKRQLALAGAQGALALVAALLRSW